MTRPAFPPPFAVGDRVVYHGNDWGRYRDPADRETIVWVRDGATGVVLRNRPGMPAFPGEEYPLDGCSVVRFDHDPDGVDNVAVSFDEDEETGRRKAPARYRRIES